METTEIKNLNPVTVDPNLVAAQTVAPETMHATEQGDINSVVVLELPIQEGAAPAPSVGEDVPLKDSIKEFVPTPEVPEGFKPMAKALGRSALEGGKKAALAVSRGAKKAGIKVAETYRKMTPENKADTVAAMAIAAETGFVYNQERKEGASKIKAVTKAGQMAIARTVEYRAMKRADFDLAA